MADLLTSIISIARSAGKVILEIYCEDDVGLELKADSSPLTRADLAANTIIVDRLRQIAPKIPILSEESLMVDYTTRRQWDEYFLVDPMDGTKEFINRNGEFTVNIALIRNGCPVLGVVYIPVQDVMYVGTQVEAPKAFVSIKGEVNEIKTRPLKSDKSLTVVTSRRHGKGSDSNLFTTLAKYFDPIETQTIGSSIKFCLVASGSVDLYPRLAPTSEWDTAAAQAVVESAGGAVLDFSLRPLRYNTKRILLNPNFLVVGDKNFPLEQVLDDYTTH